jgi:hypothetical protein
MIDNPYYFEDITSKFQFGKYEGKSLWRVISENDSYVYWCINNIPDFTISHEALEQIRSLFPEFIITQNFSDHIETLYEDEEDYEDYYDEEYRNNWRTFKEEPTYERYGGSYAQDVMGYSDDEIDIIFDGDPSAYWNID